MRPHGRQGADPDADRRQASRRRAPGRRRDGRADAGRRAHRRQRREAAHERRRPARPRVPHRRAHRAKASTACAPGWIRPSRAAWPTRPTPTSSGARPPSRTRRGAALRRGDPRAVPGKLLAYNCSPSFNWKKKLDAHDHRRLPAASLARWATSSSSSRWPASMRSTTACSTWRGATASAAWRPTRSCNRRSSPPRAEGYTATKHQREVGTGYFDEVAQVIAGGEASTLALAGSTEAAQFH